jgi:dsRNA-specific ribonuclease
MVDRLVERLEQRGLVRRDDHQRSRLWVLGPGETDLFGEEEQDGERLKLENPKGRLLELCMRLRVEPPRIDRLVEGGHHVVRMSLTVEGKTIHSGDQRAVSRKTAEQRAARVLLSRMEETEAEESVRWVEDETAARLKLDNPKGKLLEWCMARKLGAAEFEQRAVPGGFRVRAVLGIRNNPFVTAWYEASARKVAEQSAASELLERLKESPEPRTSGVGDEKRETDSWGPEAGEGGGLDPRMELNELRQTGVIQDFGYEETERSGPSHQPVFTMTAWAILEDDEKITGGPVRADSKKAAQLAAAGALVDRMVAMGLLD